MVDEQECTLTGHSGEVSSAAYSPDGKHVASASGGDNTTGKCIFTNRTAMRNKMSFVLIASCHLACNRWLKTLVFSIMNHGA